MLGKTFNRKKIFLMCNVHLEQHHCIITQSIFNYRQSQLESSEQEHLRV